MTHNEKAEMLRDTITHLYSNEGRSKSYISNLLYISRTTIRNKIIEWNLPKAKPRKHLSPSNQKFLNKHKQFIKSELDKDTSFTNIAHSLNIDRRFLYRIVENDKTLTQSHKEWKERSELRHQQYIENLKSISSRCYEYSDLVGEIWKPILGFECYDVSNKGRIRKFAKKYKSYYLLNQQPNKNNERLYIRLYNLNGKTKNLQVSNIVAHAFVEGYSNENNTVNHIDGNVQNNCSDNLEWVSQSQNNQHSYRKLNRVKVVGRRYKFDIILYKDKWEFKTVAAFARFIDKSETQTRRYIDNAERHNIKLIRNCND